MYQCPNCSANIKFDIKRQALFCQYCNTVMPASALQKEHDAEESEFMDVQMVSCPQCGGEIVCDDNEVAAFCTYCGGSTILDRRIARSKMPGFIIPFKVTKEECIAKYKKRINRNIFAPSAMKNAQGVDSFRGIYMPYWSYAMQKEGPISITASKSEMKGNYRYTYHYRIDTNVNYQYDGVNHDASSAFADNLSESIAPFNEAERVQFTPSYLSGFYADINDVNEMTYQADVHNFVAEDCLNALKAQGGITGYTIDNKKECTKLRPNFTRANLVMLPVWFMSTRIKDKGKERVAYSVINGQTGKVTGDMPIDILKYLGFSLALSAILFIILNFIADITPSPLTTSVIANVMNLIMTCIYWTRESKIKKRETGEDDKGKMAVGKASNYSEKSKLTFAWVPIVATVVTIIINPIEDFYYYGCAIFAMIFMIRTIIMTVRRINAISTRALPQFRRKGGDDSANV